MQEEGLYRRHRGAFACSSFEGRRTYLSALQAFERITTGLKTLCDLSEDFKSQGIPNLIRSVPDVSELLEEVQGLYIWDEEAGCELSGLLLPLEC